MAPRRAAERGSVLAEVDGDAIKAGTDPHDLARRAKLIELSRVEAGYASWEHIRFPQRHRQRESLQWNERLAQRRAAVDPVPVRQETAERDLLRRLDLFAQRGERRAAEPPQHIRVAPFPFRAARPQLAAHELLLTLELMQQRLDVASEALVRLRGRERTASARIPQDELLECIGCTLEKDLGQPARRHHTSASR